MMTVFWLLLTIPAAILYGHSDRWIERERFRLQMLRHGYQYHDQYVDGPEWKTRRRTYIKDHRHPPCWICRKPFFPLWHLHHLDYSRAGGGRERDRDLKFLCVRCHHNAHSMDRPRGLPRKLGVSLRWSTYMVWAIWSPVRLSRRAGEFWAARRERIGGSGEGRWVTGPLGRGGRR
jgi:HNH endonuclease